MSIQRFPLDAVQKVRHHIQSMLVLPNHENQPELWSTYTDVDDLPEPESLSELGSLFDFGGGADLGTTTDAHQGKWFVSTTNPGRALIKLPGLRLKPELRLVAYLYREEKIGVGAIYALPEELSTTAYLEQALTEPATSTRPPQPKNALADVMESLEGDRSPISFLIASILRREMQEFGALGKLQDWTHHRLTSSLPGKVKWQWQTPQELTDLTPKVRMFPDGKAAVEFFTCRVSPPIALFQHIDQYSANSYRAIALDRSVAIAQKA
ncbi:MAG TPA: hypothetical protein IGS53_12380 [Leptolyngbyaceae cyanobacterium M33_DOE_097]|uniref:Uncharacterized protein n=1 Tax=Oscillatoriales cyanobacterium SpSt-418 TaxID=2282169 RepID=A0A7C3KHZ5_9CYAN|nr:hypothetical protein [Leptolyngbyaceae cyanobacterium M33_DOE_097]